MTSIFTGLEHLVDALWMQVCATMNGERQPERSFALDSVTAVRAKGFKCGSEQGTFCIVGCPRA